MQIKNLTLKNIRSFERLDLNFKEGITLFSGDIGSGKTTILLAIEFALFGLLKGKISPSEILRHGEKEGYIKLHLTINSQDVIVTRFLKRTNQNITQTQGNIIIDGEENQLVATEIKSKILELLGYPQSLINKSTNLFRYTVFTPQEEVKAILFESIDERKDIIRKLFSLDKYKNIATNISYYQSYLREKIQNNLGKLEDLEKIKEQKKAKETEIQILNEEIKLKSEQFILQTKVKLDLQNKLKLLETEQEEVRKQKQKIELSKRNLDNINQTIGILEKQKKDLEEKLSKIEIKQIVYDETKKAELKEKINKFSEQKLKIIKLQGEISAQKNQIKKITSSIISLDDCPTCKQKVSSTHKENIEKEQNDLLQKLNNKENQSNDSIKQLDINIEKLNTKLDDLTKLEKDFILEKQKINLEKSIKEQINNILKQLSDYKKRFDEETNNYKILTSKELKEIDLTKEKNQFELLQRKERELELDLKSKQTRLDISKNTIDELAKAILEKEKLKEETNNLVLIKNWITDLFLPLLSTIEKKLMSKIYREFNQLFIKWFQVLIDDESIYVKLDENFSPILEQNGFDTGIENLSGGEKTSTALAYRLALNKVLNEYFSTVNTKDLLILDEPTDGFSSEQLDKLSIVLKEFCAKQIIVVSHEQKLESLAQNLVRITKEQNSSKIFA